MSDRSLALDTVLDDLARQFAQATERGSVARYIPQLASVDPRHFAIALVTGSGTEMVAGDADTPFSIQSISKVFTLTLALEQEGDALWQRVGREPSGDPFNSIVQLEYESGVPRNPFINAGAIVVTDALLQSDDHQQAISRTLQFLRALGEDDSISVDAEVAQSERDHAYRNLALANFMKAHGNLLHEPAATVNVYIQNCAIAMSCRQLARAGRYLAWDGRLGPYGSRITSSRNARRVNALMLTCGHYDGSGEFAFRVGIPGKSGVGGGILAVVPGQASIACWSPGLNAAGNSLLGTLALEQLAQQTGWSVFAAD